LGTWLEIHFWRAINARGAARLEIFEDPLGTKKLKN